MNIMVLGATGRTGKLVVRQALDQGHVVTVLVRNLSKLGMAHANLKYIEGDVLDSEAVETAMEGNEAVISTLGLPPGQKSDELMTRCMPIIVKAMQLAWGASIGLYIGHHHENWSALVLAEGDHADDHPLHAFRPGKGQAVERRFFAHNNCGLDAGVSSDPDRWASDGALSLW